MSNGYDRRSDDLLDFEPDSIEEDIFDDDKLERVLGEIAEIKNTINELPDADYEGASGYTSGASERRDDVRFARTTHRIQEDIRRLNTRINDMESFGGYRDDEVTGTVSHLCMLVEDLVRATRESERRLSDELNSIKNQLYKNSASGDLTSVLNAIKANLKSSEDFIININNAVDGLSAVSGEKKECGGGCDTELLRHIYELKTLVGAVSPAMAKKNEELSELYGLLAKVKYELKRENATVADKYSAVDMLTRRLYETTECDVVPIVESINAVIDMLGRLPLDVDTANDVFDYAGANEQFSIPASRKEAIRSYLSKVDAMMREGASDSVDELPDLIATKNSIQNNRNEFECESIYSSILNTNITLLNEKDPAKIKLLKAEIKRQIKRLTILEVSDLIAYPYVKISRPYRVSRLSESEGLSAKVAEIKNMMLDAPRGKTDESVDSESVDARVGNMSEISQGILDLKGDCLAILDKLDNNGEGGSVSAITLEEIVAQLDRLFDDIRNLATDSENGIMGAIEVLGDAIAGISQVQDDNAKAALEDRVKLLNDVAFIRASIEHGEGVRVEQPEIPVMMSDGGVEGTESEPEVKVDYSERLDVIERNQQAILDALDYLVLRAQPGADDNNAPTAPTILREGASDILDALARIESKLDKVIEKVETPVVAPVSDGGKVDDTLKEIRLLRDQLFAVSMASVSDGDADDYESYNNIILNEIYALADTVDALVEKMENQPASTPDGEEKMAEEIAQLRNTLTEAITDKKEDDELMKEIKKIRETLNKKAPVTPSVVTAPAPKKKSKKSVTPIAKETSVSELLQKMGKTNIIRDDD